MKIILCRKSLIMVNVILLIFCGGPADIFTFSVKLNLFLGSLNPSWSRFCQEIVSFVFQIKKGRQISKKWMQLVMSECDLELLSVCLVSQNKLLTTLSCSWYRHIFLVLLSSLFSSSSLFSLFFSPNHLFLYHSFWPIFLCQ